MTKAPIRLQDLRRSLYIKAKAERACRFWGLYVHVCNFLLGCCSGLTRSLEQVISGGEGTLRK